MIGIISFYLQWSSTFIISWTLFKCVGVSVTWRAPRVCSLQGLLRTSLYSSTHQVRDHVTPWRPGSVVRSKVHSFQSSSALELSSLSSPLTQHTRDSFSGGLSFPSFRLSISPLSFSPSPGERNRERKRLLWQRGGTMRPLNGQFGMQAERPGCLLHGNPFIL